MRVFVFDYVAQHEVLRGPAQELAEVMPEPDQRAHAQEYLERVGCYWVGGETAYPVLLKPDTRNEGTDS